MNGRDRVLAALNHEETERVPLDLGAHRSSGIAAIAYPKLRAYLGLPQKPVRVYDFVQQLAVIDDDVLDLFGADAIEMGRGFALEEKDWKEWTLPDGTPCQIPAWTNPVRDGKRWVVRSKTGRLIGQMPDGALYFESCYYPFAGEKPDLDHLGSVEAILWSTPSPPGPLGDGAAGDAALVEGARLLRQRTDRAIVGLFGGNLLESGQLSFRHDIFMTMLAAEPEYVHSYLERLTEPHLANLEKYLGLVGRYIDVILFGDDLGMQTGPQISPKMYREFFKPRHTRMWKRAKELANVKVLLHCSGGVRPLLPDLIEAGLDAMNPVQISCAGMDAAELKRDFGNDLTFWGGGCDTRWILAHGTPAEIRNHVGMQVETLRPCGGFVFQQVHNILADVPPENIVAMLEAVN